MYMFQKQGAMLGIKYQHHQARTITGMGHFRGDVDFWMFIYRQQLFQNKLTVMFGYFPPVDWGVNYNQEFYTESNDGFTSIENNDVSLIKNMFLFELTYRFNKGKAKKLEKNINREDEGGKGGVF